MQEKSKRDKLAEGLEQGKEDVVEFTSEMPEKAHGLMDKAKAALGGLKERAKDVVQDLKQHDE
jgi:flagellar biosynthesis/type III secretory pathway protein FliH